MTYLEAESGGNKGQLSHLLEAICRDFRQHDEDVRTGFPQMRPEIHRRISNPQGIIFRDFQGISRNKGRRILYVRSGISAEA